MQTRNLFLFLFLSLTTSVFAQTLNVDCGTQVQISATPKTGYHFVQWNDGNTDNPHIISPTEDVIYKAIFGINQYTIRFLNYNDAVLQSKVYEHGDAISYDGETPVRPSTAQYDYVFAGWSPNISYTAVGDIDYVAQYDEVVRKYTVTFRNYDGSILEQKQWEYGSLPSYVGTPKRPADAESTYTFTGWDKVISVVTGEAEYIAQFGSTTLSYTITTTAENGKTTGDGVYLYGTEVELTATANDCYRFVRWNDGNTEATHTITVSSNATYVAYFEKITYSVIVVSDNEEEGTVSINKVK